MTTNNKDGARLTVLGFYIVKGVNSCSLVLHWPRAAEAAGAHNQTIVGGGVKDREPPRAAMIRETGQEYGDDAVKKAKFLALKCNPKDFLYTGSDSTIKQGIPYLIVADKGVEIRVSAEVVSSCKIPLEGKGFDAALSTCVTPSKRDLILKIRELALDQYPEYMEPSLAKAM